MHHVNSSLDTPLLYVLHNELHLHGPRFGCGLAQSASIGAAMANAFFDATGVRMRTAPMTPARVKAVLKAAKV